VETRSIDAAADKFQLAVWVSARACMLGALLSDAEH